MFNISRDQSASLESCYYGLFDYVVVEGSFSLFLALQTVPDETSARDGRCCCLYGGPLVVLDQEHKPVLIADIKDDRWANELDKRQRADTHWQMRQGYDQMLYCCPFLTCMG
jgi:hypothetical protein